MTEREVTAESADLDIVIVSDKPTEQIEVGIVVGSELEWRNVR